MEDSFDIMVGKIFPLQLFCICYIISFKGDCFVDVVFVGHTTFICPFLYRTYVV